MLRICNLTKCFAVSGQELRVLDGFSLSLEKGEVVAIVGPSGCGKSTLIRLSAGLDQPDSGTVEVSGGDGGFEDVAIAFQDHGLLQWLTLEQNVKLGVVLQKKVAQDGDVDDILRKVGLLEFKDAFPDQLSGGMKSRAALARALLMPSSIVFLDEPFRSLDEMTRLSVATDAISLLRRRRQTVLLVTHSIAEAVRLADRVIVVSPRPMSIVGEVAIDLTEAERSSVNGRKVNELVIELHSYLFREMP